MIKKEIQGDLFAALDKAKAEWIVIPHVCNDSGGFGAGFVVALDKRFPKIKEQYQDGIKDLSLYPGNTQVCVEYPQSGKTVWIANMIAQRGFKSVSNPRPLHYGWLAHAMNQLVDCIESEVVMNWSDKRPIIVAPRFGSDLAGGDFGIIRELIESIWEDYDTYVFYL